MWTAIAVVFLISLIVVLPYYLVHHDIISSQKLQNLANIATIAALVIAMITLFLPKDSQKMVPHWVITFSWFIASILGGGALWYFLSQKKYYFALGSGVLTLLCAWWAITMSIQNDTLTQSEQIQNTDTQIGDRDKKLVFVVTKPKEGNFITSRSFSIEGMGANPAKPAFLKVKLINLKTNTSTVFENDLTVNSDTSWRFDNVEFQDPGPHDLVIDATYGAALDKETLTGKITIGVIYRPSPSIISPPPQNHPELRPIQPTDKQLDTVCALVLRAKQLNNPKDPIHQFKAFELLNQALALASTQGNSVEIQRTKKKAQEIWDMGHRPEALEVFVEAFHCD